jgi:hypothetical protein
LGFLTIGICKRRARNATIAISALITAIFSSIYAAYCLIVVSMYLVGYTDATQRNKEAEQDGARQPATRRVLKAEGGDKPQPESEGRSQ